MTTKETKTIYKGREMSQISVTIRQKQLHWKFIKTINLQYNIS